MLANIANRAERLRSIAKTAGWSDAPAECWRWAGHIRLRGAPRVVWQMAKRPGAWSRKAVREGATMRQIVGTLRRYILGRHGPLLHARSQGGWDSPALRQDGCALLGRLRRRRGAGIASAGAGRTSREVAQLGARPRRRCAAVGGPHAEMPRMGAPCAGTACWRRVC